MTARRVEVAGRRLSEFLRSSAETFERVDVISAPPSWPSLKPDFVNFARRHRAAGIPLPIFRGVPLCLFGSEWSGVRSAPRTEPAIGRCTDCDARDACGFDREVPADLSPISRAPLSSRWMEYGETFRRLTGCDTTAATPILERLIDTYRGPVSLEPSVLVDRSIEAALRFVVFPHRTPTGSEAAPAYARALDCVREVTAAMCGTRPDELIAALAALPPMPVPIGLDLRGDAFSVKVYLRVEDQSPEQRSSILDGLSRLAPSMTRVSPLDLRMVGLVLDGSGLQAVKAYLAARPAGPATAGFPAPLASDHPLVTMSADSALATLDIWCRGTRRADKWDFNLRDHYLAGDSARRLIARLASPRIADELRPLLMGETYRADVIAVGVRQHVLALYMELN